jgi:8-oxo-dGTP pyrophosphatase MutT (NUDIX family)
MAFRRNTARVLPVDPEGRVLLLHGWDPRQPLERFWFTIGGAAEHGEELRAAGARELHEEVGITIGEELLGEPFHTAFIEFTWAGMQFMQDQTFYAVALPAGVPVSFDGMEMLERSTVDKHAWLTPEELEAEELGHTDPRLPEVMRLAIAAVLPRPETVRD